MDLISKHTRNAFREHLVGWTLATIRDLFDCEDIVCGAIDSARPISGERRSLVEEYYASIDWSSVDDTRKVLRVFEHILLKLQAPNSFGYPDDNFRERELQKLENFLKRDGFY